MAELSKDEKFRKMLREERMAIATTNCLLQSYAEKLNNVMIHIGNTKSKLTSFNKVETSLVHSSNKIVFCLELSDNSSFDMKISCVKTDYTLLGKIISEESTTFYIDKSLNIKFNDSCLSVEYSKRTNFESCVCAIYGLILGYRVPHYCSALETKLQGSENCIAGVRFVTLQIKSGSTVQSVFDISRDTCDFVFKHFNFNLLVLCKGTPPTLLVYDDKTKLYRSELEISGNVFVPELTRNSRDFNKTVKELKTLYTYL